MRYLEPECRVVGTAADGKELLRKATRVETDVFVLDLHMPKISGLDAARALSQTHPEAKIIILTVSHDPELAAEAMEAGCMGYVVKDSAGPDLLAAIRQALRGRRYISPQVPPLQEVSAGPRRTAPLTARQAEVVTLLAGGLSMKQAGQALGISDRTVADHKYAAMKSLGLGSSAELYAYAARRERSVDP
jgi:DNA-binding NarL/FixJ family response regulator